MLITYNNGTRMYVASMCVLIIEKTFPSREVIVKGD